jgi:hypothetical protein
MRRDTTLLAAGTICLAALMAVGWLAPSRPIHAQDKSKSMKKSSKPGRVKPQANTKNLDTKADQIQSSFARDAEELAGQYVDAGHLEKARALLESVLAVHPQSPNIQKKLEQIKEGILNANDYEVEVNPSQHWKPSGAMVFENRPLRIRAEGSYRFDAGSGAITAAGFPDKDPAEDMVSGIVNEGKSSKPFLIGESLDFTPKDNGMLMLRINAPPGNKNNGKIKVSISGYVQTK